MFCVIGVMWFFIMCVSSVLKCIWKYGVILLCVGWVGVVFFIRVSVFILNIVISLLSRIFLVCWKRLDLVIVVCGLMSGVGLWCVMCRCVEEGLGCLLMLI